MRANDAFALETLLVQALSTSDHLEYDQVGAHLATALDALRREVARPRPVRSMRLRCHPVAQ